MLAESCTSQFFVYNQHAPALVSKETDLEKRVARDVVGDKF